MKHLALVFGMLSISASAYAGKDCEELKGEIDAKIKAKGVATFSLDVVTTEATAEGKIVGTCEGGTKKIVYARGTGSAPAVTVSEKSSTEAK